MKIIKVPTGKIFVIDGEHGKLECLSLADYGKEKNVKADFLGLTRELNGVPNGKPLPLSKKWVITISSQYGCSMNCRFCCVPQVGPGRNATYADLNRQIIAAIGTESCYKTERLNIHYARMGEPTFNRNVILHAYDLRHRLRWFVEAGTVHPVVSTMLPRGNRELGDFLRDWCHIKNDPDLYDGEAGLQFSINSTSDEQREAMFSGNSLPLANIAAIGEALPMPKGRKYALNFALADGCEIDAAKLKRWFDPEKFMVKITPMHNTGACIRNGIRTTGGYEYFTPYQAAEEALREAGFDVLVFIPSSDEDDGLITCGNAILSGTEPRVKHQTVEV